MPGLLSLPVRPRVLLPGLLLVALAACGGGEGSPTIAPGDATTPTSSTASGATPSSTASGATPSSTASGATPSSTASGATPSSTASGAVLSIAVRGGTVEGASRQRATLNQPVTIRVQSDVADEVHVHGYDKRVDVAAGRTAELTFVANIPGVFEVELERAHQLLFTLEVR